METINSSVDTDEKGNKRLKLQHEDRISYLPDKVIHRVLSFLPSTKEAIQTGILSKRWRNQWSRVPVLIFDFKECDIHEKDCARWVDNTLILYECWKLKKFHIGYHSIADTSFTEKIIFAVRRNVEELSILDYSETMIGGDDDTNAYILPEFIFDNAFLVKFTFLQCGFQLSRRVNWPSLKELTMDLFFLKDSGSIENVLSGSPSLEFLTISFFSTRTLVTIASKSLKKLNFSQYMDIINDLEISCPNLKELSIFSHDIDDDEPPIFPRKTLLNVLSRSPLLHFLTLQCFLEPPLVIASKSLKELVLCPRLCAEIPCPNLEKLIWFGSDFEKCKLINLPASCRSTLYFETSEL